MNGLICLGPSQTERNYIESRDKYIISQCSRPWKILFSAVINRIYQSNQDLSYIFLLFVGLSCRMDDSREPRVSRWRCLNWNWISVAMLFMCLPLFVSFLHVGRGAWLMSRLSWLEKREAGDAVDQLVSCVPSRAPRAAHLLFLPKQITLHQYAMYIHDGYMFLRI
jgi:hypothetical protein